MIAYDRTRPLIFLHIPKMGGTSMRKQFQEAYKDGLFLHYNEQIMSSGLLLLRQPGKLDWPRLEKLAQVKPVCIYGHFRRAEGTGADQVYPEATQFATVLRNPVEATISSYFYTRRKIGEGIPIPLKQRSINEWLKTVNSQIFNHMPAEAATDMEHFVRHRMVMAATLEDLSGLQHFMAQQFNIHSPAEHLNESARDEVIDPQVLKNWLIRNEKEIAFYEMVRAVCGRAIKGAAE